MLYLGGMVKKETYVQKTKSEKVEMAQIKENDMQRKPNSIH